MIKTHYCDYIIKADARFGRLGMLVAIPPTTYNIVCLNDTLIIEVGASLQHLWMEYFMDQYLKVIRSN